MSYLRKKLTQESRAITDSQEAQQAPSSKASQEAKQVQQSQQTPPTRQSQQAKQVPPSKQSQQAKQVRQTGEAAQSKAVPKTQVSQEFQAMMDNIEFPESRLDLTKRTTSERRRLSDDEEVVEIKLKNAFKLMKEQRYGAARHILRELPPDNPKVERLMAMMEGKAEKNKSAGAVSKWAVFMVLLVVIAVGGAIGAALFFQNYLNTFTLDELFTQGLGVDAGDYATINTIVNFCLTATDMKPNSCLQWPSVVMSEYPDTLDVCFAPFNSKYNLSSEDMRTIGNCLNGYDVPAPY
jgi:hypothetical protein